MDNPRELLQEVSVACTPIYFSMVEKTFTLLKKTVVNQQALYLLDGGSQGSIIPLQP